MLKYISYKVTNFIIVDLQTNPLCNVTIVSNPFFLMLLIVLSPLSSLLNSSLCFFQKLIPQVEFLDLSHNELSHVENLQVCFWSVVFFVVKKGETVR